MGAGGMREALSAHFVSPDVIAVPERALGYAGGTLVRDPDGHVIQLIER
jgi:hypothetical protein